MFALLRRPIQRRRTWDTDISMVDGTTECIGHLFAWHYYVKQSIQAGGCATYRNEDRERQQFEALQKKWGSDIVKRDSSDKSNKATKAKRREDYNPIIKIPIKGV